VKRCHASRCKVWIAAIAAQHAQDDGFNLNNYQMLSCVVYTDGAFIRAWGGVDTQTFSYDDGKPTTDPSHIHVDITLSQKINLLWINENANWGRFAHEFGHNIVSAPTETGDGTATLGEDVYGSDLVDAGAATAQDFDLMGNPKRVFEKSHAGAIRFSIRLIEARSIIVSEVCTRYS
jgi:hypothetical protein